MNINIELNRIMNAAIDREARRHSCGRCGGSGDVVSVIYRGDEDEEETTACCPVCNGDGFVEGDQ